MWPTYWLNVPVKNSTSLLSDGFTLTNARFKASGSITILKKELLLEFAGSGIDHHGQARIDIHVDGEVPSFAETAEVKVFPFQEVYSWTGDALVVIGQGNISVNNDLLTAFWNFTIRSESWPSSSSHARNDKIQVIKIDGIRLFHRAARKQVYYVVKARSHVIEETPQPQLEEEALNAISTDSVDGPTVASTRSEWIYSSLVPLVKNRPTLAVLPSTSRVSSQTTPTASPIESSTDLVDQTITTTALTPQTLIQTSTTTAATPVTGRPDFVVYPPKVLDVASGKRLQLRCQAYGNPAVRMIWKKNGRRMRTNKRMKINSMNHLTIYKTRTKDSGHYECIAINRLGKVRVTMQLTVLGKQVLVTAATKETTAATIRSPSTVQSPSTILSVATTAASTVGQKSTTDRTAQTTHPFSSAQQTTVTSSSWQVTSSHQAVRSTNQAVTSTHQTRTISNQTLSSSNQTQSSNQATMLDQPATSLNQAVTLHKGMTAPLQQMVQSFDPATTTHHTSGTDRNGAGQGGISTARYLTGVKSSSSQTSHSNSVQPATVNDTFAKERHQKTTSEKSQTTDHQDAPSVTPTMLTTMSKAPPATTEKPTALADVSLPTLQVTDGFLIDTNLPSASNGIHSTLTATTLRPQPVEEIATSSSVSHPTITQSATLNETSETGTSNAPFSTTTAASRRATFPVNEILTGTGTAVSTTQLLLSGRISIQQQTPESEEPPKFVEKPRLMMARRGDTVVFDCRAVGRPTPIIRWRTPHNASIEDHKRLTVLHGGSLQVHEAEVSDSGEYECTATSKDITISAKARLQIFVAAAVSKLPPHHYINEGKTLAINCTASGVPTPTVTWDFPTDMSQDDKKAVQVLPNSTLVITPTGMNHSGIYTCQAVNVAGRDLSRVYITVMTSPSITMLTRNRTVVWGENVTLPCPAEGNPVPNISWILHTPQAAVTLSTSREPKSIHGAVNWQVLNGSMLQLNGVLGYFYGDGSHGKQLRLTCLAENPSGQAGQTIVLRVVHQSPMELIVQHFGNHGGFLHLICPTNHRHIHWQRDTSPFRAPLNVVIIHHHLFVFNITARDSGSYSCSGTNRTVVASREIKITDLQPPKIDSLPHHLVKQVGQSLQMTCTGSGYPLPQVHWRRDGMIFSSINTTATGGEQTVDEVEYQANVSSVLQLARLSLLSAGVYTCEAINSAGVARKSLLLVVEDPPVLVAAPNNVTITLSSSTPQAIVLPCSASGHPRPTIVWLRNGKLHKINSSNAQFTVTSNGSLILQSHNSSGAEKYTCIAYNNAGIFSKTVWIIHEESPTVRVFHDRTKLKALEGSVLMLPCKSQGYPLPHVEWLKDGQPIASAGVEHFVSTNNSLVLINVRKEYEGHYMCRASNHLAQANASVVLRMKVSKIPPIISALANRTATAGDHVYLNCHASGTPQPIITWLFNNRSLSSVHTLRNGLLTLANVGDWWAGVWVCIAKNDIGEDRKQFHLTVHNRPDFLITPDDVITYIGQPVQFTCSARGVPMPTVSWQIGDLPTLDNSSSVTVEDGYSTLTIHAVSLSHNGTIRCTASNEAGTEKTDALLLIKAADPPMPQLTVDPDLTLSVGATFILHCVTITMKQGYYPAGPELVTWLHNGKEIPGSRSEHVTRDNGTNLTVNADSVMVGGVYSCLVSSLAGNSTAQTEIRVIERPSLRRVTNNLSKLPKRRVLLHCQPPHAFRKSAVNWVRLPGHDAIHPNRTFQITRAKALRFRLSNDTAGLYQCMVHVAGITLSHTSFVSLKGSTPAPLLIHPLPAQLISPGRSVRWQCPITSNPLPTYQWRKNNVPLSETTWPRGEGSELVFRHVDESDSGNYTCVAMNKAGRVETIVTLTVMQVTCKAEEGEFPIGRSWMVPGCKACSCQAGGNITCERVQCPRLNCVHQVTLQGACCPICKACDSINSSKSCALSACDGRLCAAHPTAQCHVMACEPCHVYFTMNNRHVNCTMAECRDDKGRVKENHSRWNTSVCSHKCHCEQGLARCKPITCPPCLKGEPHRVPGQCCPVCRVGWSSCQLKRWSHWSPCSHSCGKGSRHRTRHLQSASGEGDCRGVVRQTKQCHVMPCKKKKDKMEQKTKQYNILVVYNTNQSPLIKCRHANRRLKVTRWYHGDKKHRTPIQLSRRLRLLPKYKFLRLIKAQPSDSGALFTCDGTDSFGKRWLVTVKLLHSKDLDRQ